MNARSVLRMVSLAPWLAVMIGAAVPPAGADLTEMRPSPWSGGGGVGFLTGTPDGVAELALNGYADYFITRQISVGPLAQYAGAGNDVLFGLSVQAKYWWDLPNTGQRTRMVAQGGIGFVRAGIEDSDGSGTADTYGSFLIPIGVGLDYALSRRVALTADVLVNVTSLGARVQVGGREFDLHTNVMPGFYLGVRF